MVIYITVSFFLMLFVGAAGYVCGLTDGARKKKATCYVDWDFVWEKVDDKLRGGAFADDVVREWIEDYVIMELEKNNME